MDCRRYLWLPTTVVVLQKLRPQLIRFLFSPTRLAGTIRRSLAMKRSSCQMETPAKLLWTLPIAWRKWMFIPANLSIRTRFPVRRSGFWILLFPMTKICVQNAPTNVPPTASGCVRAMAGSSAAIMTPIPVWNGAMLPSADGIKPASTVPAWTPAKINAS